MDPNATLKNLRAALDKISLAVPLSEFGDDIEDALTAFDALDEWLKSGGFLPEDWNHFRPAYPHANRSNPED